MSEITASALARALRAVSGCAGLTPEQLEPLPQKGLSHAHWRIAGKRLVVRVPRAAANGPETAARLARQAAAFERASASGHAPRLHGVLPPVDQLAGGALVVDEVVGRPPRLPQELPALAAALASLHALALPAPEDGPPLPEPRDPFALTVSAIAAGLRGPAAAGLEPEAAAALDAELEWLEAYARAIKLRPAPPRTLALADTHPGNFLIDAQGRAIFIDLEKAHYGQPAIDLAHATLPPSVDWDPDCAAELSPEAILGFYCHYLERVGLGLASAIRPWLLPCRRLTWLRTTGFFLTWRAGSAAGAALDPRMRTHVAAVVARHLAPARIAASRAEWLERRWIEP